MHKYLTQKTISITVLFFAITGLAWFGYAKYQEQQQKQAEIVRVEEERGVERERSMIDAEKKSETKEEIRDKKLIADLARINKEPVENTHLQIEQATENHVRGKVTFDFEPRKNSLFFATDIPYESSIARASGRLEIVSNDLDESIDCESAKRYLFPESMIRDCVKTKKTSTSSVIVVPKYWKLVSDNSVMACPKVYDGEVSVDAWYEWRNSYSEKDWVINVAKDDLSKLVVVFPNQPYFVASEISKELEDRLKMATKENPMKIIIKGIISQCEGLPWITF